MLRSAEQVPLELPLAGPASRMLAYAIDYLVIALIELLLVLLIVLGGAASQALAGWLQQLGERAGEISARDPSAIGNLLPLFLAVLILFQVVAEWGYFLVSEMTTGGRSLGKAVVGLRVVGDGGGRLGLRASLVRNLLRLVDVLPSSYLVGLVTMLVSPEGKRIGDLVAGTVVVRLDDPGLTAPAEPTGAVDPAAFHFERRQLARIGAAERTLMLQTLRRVSELSPEAAQRALERSCGVLCERLELPPVEARRCRAFLLALWEASQRHPGGRG